MLTKRFFAMLMCICLLSTGQFITAAKPAEAATLGVFGDNDFVREIRVVRLFGLRIAEASAPKLETGGTAGVTTELTQFRNSIVGDFAIDTGSVPAGEFAMGWIRFSGSLTFDNTLSSVQSATILTDMLVQGSITNPDPDKINTLEAIVTLTQDGETVFSANIGGPGTTRLNTRTGAGSPFGGVTALTFAPNATSVVEYSFFAQVAVNGPQPAAVPLPASGLMLMAGLGVMILNRKAISA